MIRKLRDVVAVIRSYNNPFVAKAVGNLLAMDVGAVYVVVNAGPNADKGSTRGFLGEMFKDPRVRIFEMREGYSWCNALNLAAMAIQIANEKSKKEARPEFRFILNISVETKLTRKNLEEMLDTITDDPKVGVVGTSFKGLQSGNEVGLGRSYRHPRNTGMLIRLEVLGRMFGGFDPRCDNLGGMEDIEFVLRMLALTNLSYEMLDLKVPLVVGVNYDQPTKETREREAMDQIIAFWRGFFEKGTEERERIENAIAKMRLED